MRLPVWSVLVSTMVALPDTVTAQARGQQPTLVLSIVAGVESGNDLWEIPKQAYAVLGASGTNDTLRLVRQVSPSFAAGMSGTYFPKPALGLQGELLYVSIPMENTCAMVYNTPSDSINDQICNNLTGTVSPNSAFIISGGVILRGAPRGAISPYLRGSVSWVSYSGSSIEMSGIFVSGGQLFSRQVIGDADPKKSSLGMRLGGGLTASLGPGYQFRLEVADNIFSMARVTGPANGLGVAPEEVKYYHHLLLTMGFDVILERKRGRRY